VRKLLLLFVILSPSLGLAQSQQFFHYPAEETANTFTNTNQFEVGIVPGPVVFGSLPSPPLLGAGTIIFCSNCTLPSNPCTAGGTGAFAIYMNGAWNCSFGGGGGGGSGTVQQIQTGPGLTGGPITVTGFCGEWWDGAKYRLVYRSRDSRKWDMEH
jgi:hypothetical protein